jgi:MFS family permease
MLLCISGVIGLWGIGFFSPELINDVIGRALKAEGIAPEKQAGYRNIWAGINMIVQNTGAFAGMMVFTKLASHYGRKPVFAIGYIGAMLSTIVVFQFLNQRSDIFWMIPLMGFFQLSLFAGFSIYLPELFPTSLRSTGTSFCYNVGRFAAAAGPVFMGSLTVWLASGATTPEQKLQAFRNACGWMSGFFVLGLLTLPFAPETKGKPLPEDAKA